MRSIRISYKRIIIIMWAAVLAAAMVVALMMTIPTFLQYGDYLEGQDAAIAITLESTGKFKDAKYQNDREQLVYDMYNYYAPRHQKYTFNGYTFDNKDVVASAQKLDEAFGKVLTVRGFKCYRGSEYLKYASLQSYADAHINGEIVYVSIFGSVIVIMMMINVLYILEKQKEIVVSDTSIEWKKSPKKKANILIQDVQSIELAPMHGLCLKGASFTKKIYLLKNSNELYTFLSDKLEGLRLTTSTHSETEDLKKYKELLDNGIITQEEFDAKKKQLLGL